MYPWLKLPWCPKCNEQPGVVVIPPASSVIKLCSKHQPEPLKVIDYDFSEDTRFDFGFIGFKE